MSRRLLLIGGGHSHVEVIRRFGLSPEPGVTVALVSPDRHTPYSGMLPGYIAGHYGYDDSHIDLEALCRRAGVARIESALTALDPERRSVHCADGTALAFDAVSIDTGSTPALGHIPGAQLHGTPVKPVAPFLHKWAAMRESAARATSVVRIAVVGAGAGGIEVALAMHHCIATDGGRAQIIIVNDGSTILASHPRGVQRRFRAILHARGIPVRLNAPVQRATPSALELGNNECLEVDHTIWITGAAAPAWPRACGLHTDAHGFISVNTQLQSVSHALVFAAGDVASIHDAPRPKSGVYAVRQGPPLAENLRRALRGDRLLDYRPQSAALALISAGNRYAVASYGPLWLGGDWIWRWKDHIDTGFMRTYNRA